MRADHVFPVHQSSALLARSFPDIHAAGKVQATARGDRQLRQSRSAAGRHHCCRGDRQLRQSRSAAGRRHSVDITSGGSHAAGPAAASWGTARSRGTRQRDTGLRAVGSGDSIIRNNGPRPRCRPDRRSSSPAAPNPGPRSWDPTVRWCRIRPPAGADPARRTRLSTAQGRRG